MKTHLVLALTFAMSSFAYATDDVPQPGAVAKVSTVSGQVLLAQGTRITAAQEGALLQAGDRLMTLDRSDALVAFVDGCQQRVESDSLLTIGDSPNCFNNAEQSLSFRNAIGETGGGKKKDDDDRKAAAIFDASNATGTTASTLTTGQIFAVGIAVAIPILYYRNRNRDNDGRSPMSR